MKLRVGLAAVVIFISNSIQAQSRVPYPIDAFSIHFINGATFTSTALFYDTTEAFLVFGEEPEGECVEIPTDQVDSLKFYLFRGIHRIRQGDYNCDSCDEAFITVNHNKQEKKYRASGEGISTEIYQLMRLIEANDWVIMPCRD